MSKSKIKNAVIPASGKIRLDEANINRAGIIFCNRSASAMELIFDEAALGIPLAAGEKMILETEGVTHPLCSIDVTGTVGAQFTSIIGYY